MLSTVPSMFLSKLETKSPLETCLKNKIKIPLARLAKLPCKAKPTATPAVPKIVTRDVAFIPIIPINRKAYITYIIAFTKDFKNDKSKGSSFFNVLDLSKSLNINFVILGHIKHTSKKATRFPANKGR